MNALTTAVSWAACYGDTFSSPDFLIAAGVVLFGAAAIGWMFLYTIYQIVRDLLGPEKKND